MSYILMSDLAGLGQSDASVALSAQADAFNQQAANLISTAQPMLASGDPDQINQGGQLMQQAAALQQQAAGLQAAAGGSSSSSSSSSSGSSVTPTQVLDTFSKALTTGLNIFGTVQQATKKPPVVSMPILTTTTGPSSGTLLLIGLGVAVVAAYVLTRPSAPQQPIYLPAPAAAPAPTPAPALAKNGRLPISRNRGRGKRSRAA